MSLFSRLYATPPATDAPASFYSGWCADKFRPLANPAQREILPPHLATTTSAKLPSTMIAHLKARLEQAGTTLDNLRQLTIAWPHKHPSLRHENRADNEALVLQSRLQKYLPGVEITLASALHETVHLNRSGNQSPLHALTGRQVYAADPLLQSTRLPFIERGPTAEPSFFVLTDWYIEQGTTLANLASFIQHNGGHVLAIAQDFGGGCFLQAPERAQKLRTLFNHAAKGDPAQRSPEALQEITEAALHRHGRSLSTLTHGETRRLCKEYEGDPEGFRTLVAALQGPA
ncbi:MAG: hypothetical protein KKA05_03630 [Alphaproteobacteria bacterium]|nr:hypothetical protein [Alphaproteobacteria bacterium]MBU0858893.1 hypothetical protein [Alphaproteobacteria bacterium]